VAAIRRLYEAGISRIETAKGVVDGTRWNAYNPSSLEVDRRKPGFPNASNRNA
jgi:hypothetical protein